MSWWGEKEEWKLTTYCSCTQPMVQNLGKECYFGGHPPVLGDGGVAMGEVIEGLHGALAEVRTRVSCFAYEWMLLG